MYFRFLTLAFTSLIFATGTFGQVSAPSKIAVVSSYDFADEKAGITKYVTASKALIAEFTPLQNELRTMNARLETLSKEIENLSKLPAADRKAIDLKRDEGEKLQRDIKFKSEDLQFKANKRQQEVLGPVQQSIGKGLQDYAKLKGYTLIFDMAKDQNGLLIAVGDQSVDVTKDFIAFYNAKP